MTKNKKSAVDLKQVQKWWNDNGHFNNDHYKKLKRYLIKAKEDLENGKK
jgi:hypothetical protein